MAVIWETVDRLGRPVAMNEAGWSHIRENHQELGRGRFELVPSDIRAAVEDADEVRRGRQYSRRAIHFRQTRYEGLRLRVVVNYRPSERAGWVGDVITAFVTDRQYKNEVQPWP